MKFLNKIGLGKKEEEEKEEVPKQPKPNRFLQAIKILNQPMGGGLGFNPTPKRTLRERQLGIPEYVPPNERAPNFIPPKQEVPKPKEVITNWRPRPGVQNKKGSTW